MVLLMLTWTTGCSIDTQDNETSQKPKPVKLLSIQEESRPVVLEYTGIVEAASIKKLAFKSSGKIDKILVKKGEKIKAGQPLVQLDTKDLSYSLAASQGQLNAAQAEYAKAVNGAVPEDIKQMEANVKKAEAAYTFAKDHYEKMQHLYGSGAISQSELDKAKVELEAREADYTTAKEMEKKAKNGSRAEDQAAAKGQLDQAAADYKYKASLIEDALLHSNGEGYVVDLLYKEGELAPAGYPVVVVRDDQQVVKVGLSSKDLKKVNIGTKAKIRINGEEIEGGVSNINQTPDEATLTYAVEIALPNNNWPIGAIGQVDFIIDEALGIWIPITAILSNGEDYVFVMQNDQAHQRKIRLSEVSGNMVKVEGLKADEQLVIEGMKKLKDQDFVSVQN